MGKTRTVLIGESEKKGAKKTTAPKHKLSQRQEKGVRIPGLKGGERIVAVTSEPLAEKEEEGKPTTKTKKKKLKTRGEKYNQAKQKIDRNKYYPLNEAIELVKASSYTKFEGSIELHLTLKKDTNSLNVDLPYPSGRQKNIEVATDATIEKLKKGVIDFDILLATPEMMPKLVPYASLLGPKGLMPNPKNQTIIKSEKEAAKFSTNRVILKTEKKLPLIHTVIGKVKQETKELVENAQALLNAAGKRNIAKAYLCATMGPSIKLEITI